MMDNGWIKIHYKLRDWEWYTDPNMVSLWVHILIEANWKDKRWKGITIQRGQLLTSRVALAASTGLSEQQVRTCLDRLIACGQITKKITNKYSLITVCKYDDYQVNESIEQPTNNQQITNKQPTNNQQITTTKEIEEYKEVKNINPPPIIPPLNGRVGYDFYGSFHNVELKPGELLKLRMDFGEEETQSAIDDLSCKLMDGTQQSNAHYATLTYWLANRRKKKLREKEREPKGRDIIGNDNEFTSD